MSIEEGFKTVHKAMFGFGVNEYHSLGKCTRCKQELRFSPVNGNCQPGCCFKFGWKNEAPGGFRTIFNGLWVKFEWEADLCDGCLISLTEWLYGKDWWREEAEKAQELTKKQATLPE